MSGTYTHVTFTLVHILFIGYISLMLMTTHYFLIFEAEELVAPSRLKFLAIFALI